MSERCAGSAHAATDDKLNDLVRTPWLGAVPGRPLDLEGIGGPPAVPGRPPPAVPGRRWFTYPSTNPCWSKSSWTPVACRNLDASMADAILGVMLRRMDEPELDETVYEEERSDRRASSKYELRTVCVRISNSGSSSSYTTEAGPCATGDLGIAVALLSFRTWADDMRRRLERGGIGGGRLDDEEESEESDILRIFSISLWSSAANSSLVPEQDRACKALEVNPMLHSDVWDEREDAEGGARCVNVIDALDAGGDVALRERSALCFSPSASAEVDLEAALCPRKISNC
ncbi:unnamed protein product, partial [Rhizoctonia solani]